jgi:hypothetical protein
VGDQAGRGPGRIGTAWPRIPVNENENIPHFLVRENTKKPIYRQVHNPGKNYVF